MPPCVDISDVTLLTKADSAICLDNFTITVKKLNGRKVHMKNVTRREAIGAIVAGSTGLALAGIEGTVNADEKEETVTTGRTFQLGEGWHSNENAVRFWIPSPRIPKEADARCYAYTTAYATMIPLCNVC
jgi:hypothetical protein